MAAQAETTGETVCPECGRKFKRASALGAHRWQAHRVAGSSPQARSRRRTTKAATGGRNSGGSVGTEVRATAAGDFVVDRDALLRIVFPNGIPVRDDVIRTVSRWLDEAEMLARLR
ncbi:MAG: C2H2-type zinc finger protein [Actinobacteria bacterium]|nr:MAG: C2H2-type zinc finger protein [Actinomycetota bacterium]